MYVVAVIGLYVHIFGAVLSSTRAETVKTERILVSRAALVVIVFTARVKLTVNKIPVPTSLCFVISERNSAPVVVYLYGFVIKYSYFYYVSVSLSRLVDRV